MTAAVPPSSSPVEQNDEKDASIIAKDHADGVDGDAKVNGVKEEAEESVKAEDGEEETGEAKMEDDDEEDPNEDPEEHARRIGKLRFLLQRSSIYSRIMGEKMAKERDARIAASRAPASGPQKDSSQVHQKTRTSARAAAAGKGQETESPSKSITRNGRKSRAVVQESDDEDGEQQQAAGKTAAASGGKSKKRRRGEEKYKVSEYLDEQDLAEATAAAAEEEEGDNDGKEEEGGEPAAVSSGERTQPALITGAKMRDYQLDGTEWLISLYENGLNGILADEMGLGKTLQTIAFFAHLKAHGVWGPFLVVAPLSTLSNWVLEFQRFAPDLPVVMYYGDAQERADIRKERLVQPRASRFAKGKGGGAPSAAEKEAEKKLKQAQMAYPVVVTTYEVAMRDRIHLEKNDWKYIVVDEGHRLKNLNCKLIQELKRYPSANRLILTGTPLHNNLSELWSLLNFILPDIFDDLETFEKWFDFSDMHDEQGSQKIFRKRAGVSQDQATSIITQLHEILKPFLLRRLKVDVESNLPPKKEYLLYAPLTKMQKDLYDAILSKDTKNYLLEKKTGLSMQEIREVLGGVEPFNGTFSTTPSVIGTPEIQGSSPAPGKSAETSRSGTPSRRLLGRSAKKARLSYADPDEGDVWDVDEDPSRGGTRTGTPVTTDQERDRQGKEYLIKQARKEIYNMHLENIVMQLRKICCHPYLFDWPRDPDTGLQTSDDNLIHASGKMLLLNRLLDALFAEGHKVLVFSQFTTMLDIIEDWADQYKGIRTCRIDGNTSQTERMEQMHSFNNEKGSNACNLFLLSTRAGGLGINLVAADTVIFYDSDWNPQMDLQAQDRVHRIGQTKPVLIFRLVSANTVEQRILKRAGNKRKLEALVIQQGKFKMPAGWDANAIVGGKPSKATRNAEADEMAKELLELEAEKVVLAGKDDEIISDRDLSILLDRSPAAYERQLGWAADAQGDDKKGKKGGKKGAAETSSRPVFEVSETRQDEANEEIAKLLAGGK